MILTVLTYDINTEDCAGRRRLQKIAKLCEAMGKRVQNSVFEIRADLQEIEQLKTELSAIIDPDQDSIRFYNMGNNSY